MGDHRISKEMIHPSVKEDILSSVGNLELLETDVKDNIVNAINSIVETKIDNPRNRELLANSLGLSAENTNSISDICSKIDEVTNKFSYKLNEMGVSTEGEKYETMVDKLDDLKPVVDKSKKTPDWYGDVWVSAATMLISRRSLTSSAVGNSIYVMAGDIDGSVSVRNDCYDAVTNSWSIKSNMVNTGGSTASINNVIYAISANRNDCYDTLSDSWSNKTTSSNSSGISVNVGNFIYSVGGDKNECYDTLTDSWTTKTAMPTSSRGSIAVSNVGSNIYAIGGAGAANVCSNKNECYDTLTDSWTDKAVLPTTRYGLTASSVNENIYVICGYRDGYWSSNECYDTVNDKWTTKSNNPVGRNYLTSSVVGKNIYTLGGTSGRSTNANSCYITKL